MALLFLASALPLPGPSHAQGAETAEENIQESAKSATEVVGAVRYVVRFPAIGNPELLDILKERSETFAKRSDAPSSPSTLARRATRDLEQFRQVLRSEGYYAAEVDFEIEEQTEPRQIAFTIALGVRFIFGEFKIALIGDSAMDLAPLYEAAGLEEGAPAVAQRVLDAEAAVLGYLKKHGYPFANLSDSEVVVDHAQTRVNITFGLEPGPESVFGETGTEGLERVNEEVVLKHLSWRAGDVFSVAELEATRRNLFKTGLFTLVRLDPQRDGIGSDGWVPVVITLNERKHHTIKAGARYGTDEGFGVEGGWEDRNMRGMGETLKLGATVAQNETELAAGYTFPYFRHEGQSLTLALQFEEDSLDAYDALGFSVSAHIDREVSSTLNVSGGLKFRVSNVEQNREEETYHLLSAPLSAQARFGDSGMNPANGLRLRWRIEPFIDPLDFQTLFLKSDIEVIKYIPLTRDNDWILAGRIFGGTILGVGTGTVPAYERYFAGGGGSVRGYKYQSLGILDDSDDPVGGRSIIETGIELRRKLNESLWLVGFVDGGWAGNSALPDFGQMQFGAGLGVRYLTPVGPLRFDIAVPLEQRKGVDDPLQLYISIGQAF